MSTVKRVAKNSIYNFLGNNITKVLTMVLTIFIARFFSDVEFGKLSFALSFTGLFVILIDLGTKLLVVRDIATDKKNASKYISNIIILKIWSSIIVFLIIAVIINLMGYPQDTIIAVYLGSLIIIFESLSESFEAMFQAFENMQYAAVVKIIRVLLRFTITLPLLFLGYRLIPVLIVYLIVQIISFLIILSIGIKKFTKLNLNPDFKLIKSLIVRGWPFLLSAAFVVIYFRIDITMLSIMKGDAVVGWYSVAYNLIDALTTIPMALNAALLPIAIVYFNESKDKLIKLYRLSVKLLFILSFPIVVGGTFLAKNIILLIYSNKYENSILALQILLWVLIPLFTVQILGALLIAIKKEKLGVPALFITSLTNVALNWVLIPKYSYVGASIATIISEIVYLGMYYAIISKNLEFVNIFSLAIKPFIATVLMFLFINLISKLNFILVILVSSIFYFLVLYLIKGISQEETIMLKRLIKKAEK